MLAPVQEGERGSGLAGHHPHTHTPQEAWLSGGFFPGEIGGQHLLPRTRGHGFLHPPWFKITTTFPAPPPTLFALVCPKVFTETFCCGEGRRQRWFGLGCSWRADVARHQAPGSHRPVVPTGRWP